MYQFLSGYTARVAGTEMGVFQPQLTFSPCYSAAFLVRHPVVYARLLSEKIRKEVTLFASHTTSFSVSLISIPKKTNISECLKSLESYSRGEGNIYKKNFCFL